MNTVLSNLILFGKYLIVFIIIIFIIVSLAKVLFIPIQNLLLHNSGKNVISRDKFLILTILGFLILTFTSFFEKADISLIVSSLYALLFLFIFIGKFIFQYFSQK